MAKTPHLMQPKSRIYYRRNIALTIQQQRLSIIISLQQIKSNHALCVFFKDQANELFFFKLKWNTKSSHIQHILCII